MIVLIVQHFVDKIHNWTIYAAALPTHILTECAQGISGKQQTECSTVFGKVRESCAKQVVIDLDLEAKVGVHHSSKNLGRVLLGKAAVSEKAQMHKTVQQPGVTRLAGTGEERE